MLYSITTKKELSEILQKNPVVLVAFLSPSCGACINAKPKIEELASDWTVVTVNINAPEAPKEGIDRVPTLKIFHSGKQVAEMVGFNREEVVSSLKKYSSSTQESKLSVRQHPLSDDLTVESPFRVKNFRF